MNRTRRGTQAWGFVVCVIALVLMVVPSAFGYGWVPVSNPATQTISGVSFTSAENGWIVEENGCVFHTTDGGSTWTTVTVGTSVTLRGVRFADPDHGWITGDSGTVLHTGDGGQSWQPQGVGYDASLSRPFVLDSLHAWIPVTGVGGLVAWTADGGSWWQQGVTGGGMSFRDASFSDSLNGWAVGNTGAIRRSVDGGSTWNTVADGALAAEWLYGASAIDSQSAFAVGGSGSAVCLWNGGMGYEVKQTPAPSLRAVQAFSGGEAFAAGWDAVVHTHDWGSTWLKVHSPGPVTLMDLSFPDRYTGFAAGAGGTLLKYTAPAAPSAHSLETTDAASVSVTWDASPDAAGYQVRHRGSTATVNGGGTTTRSLSLVAPGTTEFAVRAFTSENLYSAWSTATITNHGAFVDAPLVIAESTVTTSSVAVAWDVVPAAVRYEYRVNGGVAVLTLSTTATVGPLSEGNNLIEVRAGTFVSWSAWAPRNVTFAQPAILPEPPEVSAEPTVNTSSVAVAWTAVLGADRYEYRLNGGAAIPTLSTTATVGPLTEGKNLIEVRAGTLVSWSAWTPRSVTFVVQQPQLIALSRTPSSATYPTKSLRLYGTTGDHATTVTVESMVAGGTWAPAGITARSSAAGVLPAITVPLKARTYYRLRFNGDVYYKPVLSNVVYATYKPLLKSPAVPKVRRNRTFTTSVTAYTPLKNSAGVVKLRYYRWIKSTRKWKLSKTVSAARGSYGSSKTTYRARVKLTRTGTWKVKASYDGKTLYIGAYSYREFQIK